MRRALVSALVGLAVALATAALYGGVNDLVYAYGGALYLLNGQSPYAYPTGGWPSNPLTTVLALLPFAAAGVSLQAAGAAVLGGAAALYAWAVIGRGEAWRLLALLSLPALHTMVWAQWGMLLLAIWFVPALAPLTLVKPHSGWIVGLLHATPLRAAAVLAILAGCFVIWPTWLVEWLAQVGGYDGAPVAFGLGALGLLVLAVRRDRTALLYAGLLLTPVRAWYDPLPLFAVAETRRDMLVLVALSWLVPFGGAILCLYLPAALLVAYRRPVPPL